MDEVMTRKTAAISEFKQNPNQFVAEAGDEPFAVLTNNKPSFYVLSPAMFDKFQELIFDHQIAPVVRKRLAEGRKPIKVNLADLLK